MPKFFFIVRDKSGRKVSGADEAQTAEDLTSRLQAKGFTVVSILPEYKEGSGEFKPEVAAKVKFKPKHYGISTSDLAMFCRQLATLLGSGVTILKSIDVISQQVSSRKLYNVIKSLAKKMEEGLSLHEAMARHRDVFSDLWINLVESGEASGNLATILDRLAKYLERNAEFKRKIISALIYPLLLLVAGLGALLFLTLKIIPTFANLFQGFNIKLPLITQMLILASDLIRKYLIIVIGCIIAGFYLFKNYTKTKEGRRTYERFKFRLPMFGEFFRAVSVERFASEMSTLVESGVPILYSLEITEHSVDNLIMSDIIRRIKDDVRQGKSLSQPLAQSGFFEPMVVQMVSIGEEIGELAGMFKRISIFYQEYVETFLVRFTAMFEPLMLIFMGLLIGIMVLGMFMPIFQISQISG